MKKYPTPANIAEMKARGYDSDVIHEAEAQAARWPMAQELCERIKEAFAGVKLGQGVGLHEARGLDDRADEAACARLRQEDEKEDWTRISTGELNQYADTLSFFDAEGMRFHLPAFLTLEILGKFVQDLVSQLAFISLEDACLSLPDLTNTPFAQMVWPKLPPGVHEKLVELRKNQLSLLSDEQRRVIRDCLLFLADDPDHRMYRPQILKGVNEYWAEPS